MTAIDTRIVVEVSGGTIHLTIDEARAVKEAYERAILMRSIGAKVERCGGPKTCGTCGRAMGRRV